MEERKKKLQIEGKSLVCLPFTSLCHKKNGRGIRTEAEKFAPFSAIVPTC